ncbi:MAG: hypothetical protein WC924_00330 [Candidatus Gracilibacteria bacterium]
MNDAGFKVFGLRNGDDEHMFMHMSIDVFTINMIRKNDGTGKYSPKKLLHQGGIGLEVFNPFPFTANGEYVVLNSHLDVGFFHAGDGADNDHLLLTLQNIYGELTLLSGLRFFGGTGFMSTRIQLKCRFLHRLDRFSVFELSDAHLLIHGISLA